MHGLDGHTAEIEHVAVAESLGVGPWLEEELLREQSACLAPLLVGRALDLHEPVEAQHSEVVVVDVDPGVGEQAVAGHMVFVTVAVEHRVDRHVHAAVGHDRDRGIDDDRLRRAGDEQRVPRWIPATVGSDQHGHRVGQRP